MEHICGRGCGCECRHSTNDHFDNNIGGSERGRTTVGAFSVLYCCFDFIKKRTDTRWSMHIRIK